MERINASHSLYETQLDQGPITSRQYSLRGWYYAEWVCPRAEFSQRPTPTTIL